MFSRFFIARPVLANVIALVAVLAGAVALLRLPVAQYPDVVPPTIQVSTRYPGASAQTLAETVGQVVESAVNGTPGMLYMQSTSSNDGSYALTVTFAVGTDPQRAQVDVQNALAPVEAQLPEAVQRQGLRVRQRSSAILEFIALTAGDGAADSLYLSNYARIHLADPLQRVPGVGDVTIFGAGDYAMRIWLDPERMRARGLSVAAVTQAIQAQSQTGGAGAIGAPPQPEETGQQVPITVEGRLNALGGMAGLVLKTDAATGGVTRLEDVARIELGARSYGQIFRLDGQPAAAIAISQLPGANALEVAEAVNARMEELARGLPEGVAWSVPFDTTAFVSAAMDTVWETLAEAFVIVIAVILLFLQDWRAVLVPATTVPVTLMGALAAMAAMGFTLNMSTLFALVLAIGIVVDDAIVIVEGTARHLARGLPGREAAGRAMDELSGPIAGITLVLAAVFLPAAFLPGLTGRMYQQFALVIAATAVISAVNAVTLKPVQAALWMRPPRPAAERNAVFRGFERGFARLERGYARLLARLLRRWGAGTAAALLVAGLAIFGLSKVPGGFLPLEDQGYFIVSLQLAPGASLERTDRALEEAGRRLAAVPGVDKVLTVAGVSVTDGNAALPSAGLAYVVLEPWDARGRALSLAPMYQRLSQALAGLPDGAALVVPPPSIQGIGATGGLSAMVSLTDGSGDTARLAELTGAVIERARAADPAMVGLRSTTGFAAPRIDIALDRVRAARLGVSADDVFTTISGYLGSAYVNQFSWFGQTFQVYLQAEGSARQLERQIGRLSVPNADGQAVPLSELVTIAPAVAPPLLTRFDNAPAAALLGQIRGISSGKAMELVAQSAGQALPPGTAALDWTGLSYQEEIAGGQIYWVFGLALVLIYLVLAGQYESWLLPLAVILSVPLALAGTVAALLGLGLANTLYTQIGIILLVALAAKNAILIVEFARDLGRDGHGHAAAALRAGRLRLRPIMMTSLTFILGMLPLVFVTGAGSSASKSIGVAVVSGMLVQTLLAIFAVPVLFVALARLEARLRRNPATQPA
ncbi:efflux RND transporter permease subunit [Poseidonocella sp. HB161398]|uniref:efflux RND transporter permease subunit n=1 Tax=Poseidonocella sp. HB161398 TaxID=2320855 RepID=UPI0011087B95|nr:efflux RND transporter permease subunit [Poseidonocella sp. HB161398]